MLLVIKQCRHEALNPAIGRPIKLVKLTGLVNASRVKAKMLLPQQISSFGLY
jgi:hypothetical protein